VLPHELWIWVLSFLHVRDIAKTSTASKYFLSLANNSSLWKGLCERDFIIAVISTQSDWKMLYQDLALIRWNPEKHGSNVEISNNDKTAFCAQGWESVQVVHGQKSGIRTYCVQIDKMQYVGIGVSMRNTDMSTDIHTTGWSYWWTGNLNQFPTEFQSHFGDRILVRLLPHGYGDSDKVGVIVDMDQGTLRFFVNGKEKEDARITRIKEITDEVFFTVSLVKARVTLVPFKMVA